MRIAPASPRRGWHRNPLDRDHVRYWDGSQFTAEMRWENKEWVPVGHDRSRNYHGGHLRARIDPITPLEIHVHAKRPSLWFAHIRDSGNRRIRPPRPAIRG